MSCELCGGGDEWIKTCRTPEGSRLLVCDECYAEHASVLVIVPGDRVVMARCDSAGATATPGSSWRSAQEAARTPTRGRVRSAQRRGRDGRSRACRSATGWTGATRMYGRCDGPRVGSWPTSAPGVPPGRLSSRQPGKTTKAQERSSTREEDPRLHPPLQGLLVRRWQVPHKDLPRGRASPGGGLLAAARQREHLSDQHGRVPGCRGSKGAQAAHAADMDRALSRARGSSRRVLIGEGF